jgi:TRAP-type C4-dicarboxylate transport system substrate-binding protein
VNKAVWTALPKNEQDVLLDCSAKAEAAGLEKSKAADEEAIAALKSNGVQVLPPSEKLSAELAKVGETVAAEWAEKAGDAGGRITAEFAKLN